METLRKIPRSYLICLCNFQFVEYGYFLKMFPFFIVFYQCLQSFEFRDYESAVNFLCLIVSPQASWTDVFGWEVAGRSVETHIIGGTGIRMSPGKKTCETVGEIRARMERLRESLGGKEEGTVLATVGNDWKRGPLLQWL